MKLKAKLTAEPPPNLKDFYVKDGDAWILDVEAVDGFELDDVRGLKSTLAEQKERHRKAREEADSWKSLGVTLDEARGMKSELETLRTGTDPAKHKAAVESAVKQAEARMQAELEKEKKRSEFLFGQVKLNAIDAKVDVALAKYAKDENAARILRPHVLAGLDLQENEGKISVIVKDEKGTPRISTKKGAGTNPMTVEELVEEMAKDKQYAIVFKGSGAAGGGSNGAGGGGGGGHDQDLSKMNPAQKLAHQRRESAAV